MANQLTRRSARPRPDRYSDKKQGFVSQSWRVSVEDVHLIREAAALKGLSINHWMTRHLVTLAKRELARYAEKSTL
jgi:hypothetical protein